LISYNDSQVVMQEIEVLLCQTLSENQKQHAFEGSQTLAIYYSDEGSVSPLKSSAYFTKFNTKKNCMTLK
jgi:hypothetical protein